MSPQEAANSQDDVTRNFVITGMLVLTQRFEYELMGHDFRGGSLQEIEIDMPRSNDYAERELLRAFIADLTASGWTHAKIRYSNGKIYVLPNKKDLK
jgi:hypothetical protein